MEEILLFREKSEEKVESHCGRNTHLRQICFSVPNFNFKYIYKIWRIT